MENVTNFGAFSQEAVNNVNVTTADGTVQRSHAIDVFMLHTCTVIHQTLNLRTKPQSLPVSHVDSLNVTRCMAQMASTIGDSACNFKTAFICWDLLTMMVNHLTSKDYYCACQQSG